MKELLKNPFKGMTKKEWIVYALSVAIILLSNVFTEEIDYFKNVATILGATSLILIARGNAWGQIIMVVFCSMYAYTSYCFKYYGEMMTYLLMSLPISFMSIFTWLKNPYKKGENVVKIYRLSVKEVVFMFIISFFVTFVFYFILKFLNTPNLAVSTLSVTTSFIAAYLLLRRSSYYAIAYALNDVVLIVLWVLASLQDRTYLSVVFCFAMFLFNDLNGFFSWKIREKQQKINEFEQSDC